MLIFTRNASSLLVGNSFKIKDHLKNNLKARWEPEHSSWAIPVHLDCEHLRKELETMAKAAAKAQREANKVERMKKEEAERQRLIYLATPEGKEAARQQRIAMNTTLKEEDKQRIARGEAPIYWWINCVECEVLDWHRKHTSCEACGEDTGPSRNTFRVRGMIHTGD
jgi:hypothetical protein